jgi:putative membrane protein
MASSPNTRATRVVALGAAAALAATPIAAASASAHDTGSHKGWTQGKHKGWAKNLPGGALNDADRAWLVANSQVNLFEVAKANLAMTQSTDQEVRDIARHLLKTHTKDQWRVKFLSMRLGATVPTSLSSAQQAAIAEGAALTGNAFDAWFFTVNVEVHTSALAAAKAAVANGNNKLVKADARKDVRVIAHHLKALQVAWADEQAEVAAG